MFGFIGPVGWNELIVILVIVLIIFGPRRLPELAEAMGKSIRKFKSASREVEEAIYRMPQVSEVAVVGINHPRWVEAVVAVIVVKAGHALSEGQVLAHCNAALAGFKAPKGVVFVDALPKNPSGKLLKRQLRQTHADLFGVT